MKNKIIYFIAITVLFGNYQAPVVSAYDDKTTHPALTDEIVDFYNLSFPDKQLTLEQKEWIVEGSILEDTPPRWINHFYDPIAKMGWSGEHTGKYDAETVQLVSKNLIAPYGITPISSLEWLHNEQSQARYGFYKGAKTWERGILEMIKSNEKEAYQILGYILHLIEDASVPDHTRNDTHAHELEGVTGDYGSPYEEYAKDYTRENLDIAYSFYQQGLRPITKSTIDEYLISLAEYSNKYFFSKDTINDPKYQYPKIIKEDDRFGYGVDENGKEFPLARVVNTKTEKIFLLDKNDTKVIDAYFSRLSHQVVLHGAGVVNLFNNEVQVQKEYPQHAVVYDFSIINYFTIPRFSFAGTATGLWTTASNFTNSIIAVVGEAFGRIFGSINDEKLAETIDVKSLRKSNNLNENGNSKNTEDDVNQKSDKLLAQAINDHTVIKQENGQKNSQQTRTTIDEEKETKQKIIEPEQQKSQVRKEVQQEQGKQEQAIPKIQPTPPVMSKVESSFKECSFGSTLLTTSSVSYQEVIINEVAWMGGSSDFGLTSSDEWIELKNISSSEVDISNWQLIDKAEQIKINIGLAKNTKIKVGQFILLERTDDDSAPNIAADLIYSNTLNNSDEWLRLFDNQCNLVDEVIANPNWPAGDNAQKRTMERDGSTSLTTSFSWHTYSGTVKNSIFGTPKKENSMSSITYNGVGGSERANYSNSGSTSMSTDNQQQTTSSTSTTTSNDQQQPPSKILISEVQITPIGNRFIELYNPNSFQINLTNWYLQRKTQTGDSFSSLISKTYFEGKTIDANSYFLISRDILENADIILDSLTLTASNTIQLKNSNGEVIDKVGWGQASDCENNCAPEILDNQSIQRKFQATFIDTDNNVNDFEIQTCPSSKVQSRSCPTVEQAPSVLLALSITEVIYNPEGADEGKELVKIDNPNSEEINASGYSLQYLSSDGDFAKIKKKNLEVGNKIPAQGVFKIGMNCSTNTPCENVDMSWSESLNNSLGTVFLVSNKELLTGLSDADIIDGFHYPEATQLVQPSDFTANYDQNKLEINLSWNTNLSLVYQIQEYNSLGVTIFEGKGSSFSKRIDEVGKNYKFSIKAFNENAEYTQLIEKEIAVPSFIKDTRFYNSTHYTNQGETRDNLIEFSYDNYPFLPLDLVYAQQGIPTSGPNYKVLVFYLNTDAPKRVYLNGTSPLVEDIDNVLRVKYETCAGSNSPYWSLVLPDIAENCNVWGGFGNGSMYYGRYLAEGDKNLLLPAVSISGESTFTESDYITLAFYGFERVFPQGTALIDGIYPNFKLLAVDKTKYYFQSNTSMHSAPQLTGEITFNFDKQNSKLSVSWPKATDLDTLDALLTYEIKYTPSDDWKPVGAGTTKIVSAGDNFSMSVRAKDDFGNYSTPVLTKDWSYPAVDSVFTQTENNAWSSSFGQGYGYYGSDGNSINLQSIIPTVDYKFDKVSLRIKQLPVGNDPVPNDYANLKLSVYPDKNNQPDFSLLTASSTISNIYNPDSNSDLTFHFSTSISLLATNKYWLALEVESYADSRGFFRNGWQNAWSNTNPYLQGEAARVRVLNGVYNNFTLEPDNDWYMKIGFEQ